MDQAHKLGTTAVEQILQTASRYRLAASKLPNYSDVTGGYFTIIEDGQIVCTVRVGEIPIGIAPGYFERVQQADAYFHDSVDHAEKLVSEKGEESQISSSQIRDGQFTGAVSNGQYIFSFAGGSKHVREAIAALTAKRHGYLSEDQVAEIFKLSKNTIAAEIAKMEDSFPF